MGEGITIASVIDCKRHKSSCWHLFSTNSFQLMLNISYRVQLVSIPTLSITYPSQNEWSFLQMVIFSRWDFPHNGVVYPDASSLCFVIQVHDLKSIISYHMASCQVELLQYLYTVYVTNMYLCSWYYVSLMELQKLSQALFFTK